MVSISVEKYAKTTFSRMVTFCWWIDQNVAIWDKNFTCHRYYGRHFWYRRSDISISYRSYLGEGTAEKGRVYHVWKRIVGRLTEHKSRFSRLRSSVAPNPTRSTTNFPSLSGQPSLGPPAITVPVDAPSRYRTVLLLSISEIYIALVFGSRARPRGLLNWPSALPGAPERTIMTGHQTSSQYFSAAHLYRPPMCSALLCYKALEYGDSPNSSHRDCCLNQRGEPLVASSHSEYCRPCRSHRLLQWNRPTRQQCTFARGCCNNRICKVYWMTQMIRCSALTSSAGDRRAYPGRTRRVRIRTVYGPCEWIPFYDLTIMKLRLNTDRTLWQYVTVYRGSRDTVYSMYTKLYFCNIRSVIHRRFIMYGRKTGSTHTAVYGAVFFDLGTVFQRSPSAWARI